MAGGNDVRRFDAERATRFEEDWEWDGSNQISVNTGSQWHHQRLWKTARGRWVLERYSNYHGVLPTYHEITAKEAAAWLIRNGHDVPEELAGEAGELEV